MTAQHTKTPWHVDAGDKPEEILIRAWPEDEGFDICSFAVDETDSAAANAAFIVKAVNNHVDLVNSLATLLDMADTEPGMNIYSAHFT